MKVKIRKYKYNVNLYTLTKWMEKRIGEERYDRLTDSSWFNYLNKNKFWDFVNKIRKVDKPNHVIKIEKHDTWSMCDTLALIIHPMLLKMKENKYGSPFVDDEDVPDALKAINAETQPEYVGDVDSNFHLRWEYVLDEMIWAFGEMLTDWESQYHTGTFDWVSVPIDSNGNEVPKEEAKLFRMDRTDKDTSHFDKEGHKAHSDRIQNGTRLFGKYYQGLWT